MNLLSLAVLKCTYINRVVLPEAKRISTQALLGLKKVASEGSGKLLLRFFLNQVIREVAIYLYDNFLS